MTDKRIICPPIDLVQVTVPPGHAACVVAELLFLLPLPGIDGLSAVWAGLHQMRQWVAPNIRADRVDRDAQAGGDLRLRDILQTHVVKGGLLMWIHTFPPVNERRAGTPPFRK